MAKHASIVAACALLPGALLAAFLYAVQKTPPRVIASFDALAYPQCAAAPCSHTLATVRIPSGNNLRLDLYASNSAAIQIKWLLPQFNLTVTDPYTMPRSPGASHAAYVLDCPGCPGDVDILLSILDDRPCTGMRATVTAEPPRYALFESILISLPVVLVLCLLMAAAPRKAAGFSVVFMMVFLFYCVFATAPKSGQQGDNRFYLPTAYALVRQATLHLDNFAGRDAISPYTSLVSTPQGAKVNYYPAAVSVAIAPLVAWAELWQPPEERLAATIANIIAASSMALLFLICRRLGLAPPAGALVTGACALATSQLSIHAGGLYSHNLTTLLSLALCWVLLAMPRGSVFLLSALSVAGLACRHDFLLMILGCVLALLLRSRGLLLAYLAMLCALMLPLLYGFHTLYGHFIPPYVAAHGPGGIGLKNLDALAGLLVSPNRGLFVFSPLLLVGYWQAFRIIRRHRCASAVELGLAVTALTFLAALCTFPMWWGGWSYGPRLFCGMFGPVLVLTAAGIKNMLSCRGRYGLFAVLLSIAIGWGAFVHGKGALVGDDWNAAPANVDMHPERLWDMRDLQILRNISLLPAALKAKMLFFQ